MIAKFRIGYPYASSQTKTTREAVVVLKQITNYSGFTSVLVNGEVYDLPLSDKGPQIIRDYPAGVIGTLIEAHDHRKSIAKTIGQQKKIHGEGISSQLALLLAVCAIYEDSNYDHLPLLLFSAAIRRPAGANPFIDATIETYCDAELAELCLLNKYQAACISKAHALILPIRDAKILSKALEQKWQPIQALNTSRKHDQPLVIGATQTDLPEIAKVIGISPSHYQTASQKNVVAYIAAISLSLAFVLFILVYKDFFLKTAPKPKPVLKVDKKSSIAKQQWQYQEVKIGDSKLAQILQTQWLAAGAIAKLTVPSGKFYRLAYIIDPKKEKIEHFHWNGTNCVFMFSLQINKGVPNVWLDNIEIIGKHTPIPKYNKQLRQVGKARFPAHAAVATHFYYGEIKTIKTTKFKFDEGHLKLTADEKARFILRINAKKPGIYNFSLKLLLRSKNIREQITLVSNKVWLFDHK